MSSNFVITSGTSGIYYRRHIDDIVIVIIVCIRYFKIVL
jgi:hypothetical protein